MQPNEILLDTRESRRAAGCARSGPSKLHQAPAQAPARPTGILVEVAGLAGSDLICLYDQKRWADGLAGTDPGCLETMLSLLAALISGP